MGQQQLLLLTLGVLIVGLIIAVGVHLFHTMEIISNKDAILSELNVIIADLYAYSSRPNSQGGGDGHFDGYLIPALLAQTESGSYSILTKKGKAHGRGKRKGAITFVGTSSKGYGTVTVVLDDSAEVKKITFAGKFR